MKLADERRKTILIWVAIAIILAVGVAILTTGIILSTASRSLYSQTGGITSRTGASYSSSATDTSAVVVDDSGSFTLLESTISKSGDTSESDNSGFYGLNAAVLVKSGSKLTLRDSTITTSGTGANGAFATGPGSSITLSNVTINATAQFAHAVMASDAGSLTVTNVKMTTAGAYSGAVATDRGGGTITVNGGVVNTSGQDSPGIYSTGAISVSGAKIASTGAEAAVIEGSNSIDLKDTALSSSKENKWGVLLLQSMSGDARGVKGTFTMTGGSFSYTSTSGPLFFVTNSTGSITLSGVNVTAGSGVLLKAGADRWGNSGSNGGTANFTADKQTLNGNIVADSYGSVSLTLRNGSSLTGSINPDNKAKAMNLILDASSTWSVTSDSYLTSFTDSGGISGVSITNITGNGHTVYYDRSACPALGGNTYTLAGGGTLIPR